MGQDGLGLMGIGLTMKGASRRVSNFEFRVSTDDNSAIETKKGKDQWQGKKDTGERTRDEGPRAKG